MSTTALDPLAISTVVRGRAFAQAVRQVPPEMWHLSPEELTKCAKPTSTDYALRCALWNELRLNNQSTVLISPTRIYLGICTPAHFYSVIQNAAKLAWLTSPQASLKDQADSVVQGLMRRYHEVIDLDLKNNDGTLNVAVVKTLLAAMEVVMRHYATKHLDDGRG